MGGIAKGHPNVRDLDKARAFYREMQSFAIEGACPHYCDADTDNRDFGAHVTLCEEQTT